MADVVGAELHLVSIGGEALWLRHDARIVDQEVEPVGRGKEGVRGFSDGFDVTTPLLPRSLNQRIPLLSRNLAMQALRRE